MDAAITERIAHDARITPEQVAKTVALFEEGSTIPFVARYRKDATGNLNEEQLETVFSRNTYYKELLERKKFVIETIEKQGKLTDDLKQKIEACYERADLEDIYLPFKKPKRTKATVAKENGLLPLAELLWEQADGGDSIDTAAATFINAERSVNTAEEALEGACHILAERVALESGVRSLLRDHLNVKGKVISKATKKGEGAPTKYEAYKEFTEAAATIPSHRFLAIHRGEKEGYLRVELQGDNDALLAEIAPRFIKAEGSPFEPYVRRFVEDAFYRLLRPSIENEVMRVIQRRADEEAVRVFRENAQNILLAPPAGQMGVIGIDPGLRTGCKVAVVDETGAYKESAIIHPGPPQNDVEAAETVLLDLMKKYEIRAIAIGNGTGARETSAFVRSVLGKREGGDTFSVMVNEAGASIYSASKLAREEYPDLDVTIRGAISIAHRLQDPLAELVKLDPKHIGVGQYQHDVHPKLLRDGLHWTVESCVNQVGVDVNTASAALLRYISGLRGKVARTIVGYRTKNGPFSNREQLKEVDGIGPKVFEQCAGFLRISGGDQALDNTAIHPEAYSVAEKIVGATGQSMSEIVAHPETLRDVDLDAFATNEVGVLTLREIKAELIRPRRDPRKEFKAPAFLDSVQTVNDLSDGMDLEGVVTNVTDFGAFVDIGVHQDGLVHLSEMANRYVKDPQSIVKVGDIIKVRVIKVDKERPRISLSMKALLPPAEKSARPRRRAQSAPDQQGAQQSGPGTDRKATGKPSGGRPRQDSKRPQKGRPAQRSKGQQRPAKAKNTTSGKGAGAPLNTLLADQLAALKDELKK
jgi:uncharacterized protein